MLIFFFIIINKFYSQLFKTKKNYNIYNGMWRSLVAHTHGVRGVAGSNPVIPTLRIGFNFVF